jgi:YD repeat-containing protein
MIDNKTTVTTLNPLKRKIFHFSFLVFHLLFIGFLSYGQNTLDKERINYPLSPEQNKLFNIKNIDINELSGQFKYNIPIGSYGNNLTTFPLNLNYSYSGLQIMDSSSIVGNSWNLEKGGSIIRTVRDMPDESNYGIFGPAFEYYRTTKLNPMLSYELSPQNSNLSYLELDAISTKYDTERDKYTVLFNDINFSFTITNEGNPYYLSYHNYTINIDFIDENRKIVDKFTLSDNDGNKYVFSIKEKFEPLGTFNENINDSFPFYTTSWLIESINLNNNENINFYYDDEIIESYNFSCEVDKKLGNAQINFASPFYEGLDQELNQLEETTYDENFQRDHIHRKILNRVTSPLNEIYFDYITNDFTQNKLIKFIKIKNKNNKFINIYEFSYAGERDLLKSIKLNNETFYNFDYFNEDAQIPYIKSYSNMPLSKNTDYYGFYNGKSNLKYINIGSDNIFANKSSSFYHTRIFALKKIMYPTKGYSEIVYEQNAYNDEESLGEINTLMNLKFKTDGLQNFQSYVKEKTITLTFNKKTLCNLSHSITSENNAHIELSINGGPGNISLPYNVLIPSLNNQFSLPELSYLYVNATLDDNYNQNSHTLSGSSNGNFVIPAGTYVFTIKTITNHKHAEGFINFEFSNPNLIPNSIKETKTAGIRVSKIIDYDFNNIELLNKVYEYNSEDGTSYGVKILGMQKSYPAILMLDKCVVVQVVNNISFACANAKINILKHQFKSADLDVINNIPVYYSKIKISNGFENNINTKKFPYPSFASGNLDNNHDNTKVFNYISSNNYPQYGEYTKIYKKGYTIKEFMEPYTMPQLNMPILPLTSSNSRSGLIAKETIFNNNSQLIISENNYENISFNPPNQQINTNSSIMKSLKISKKIFFLGYGSFTVYYSNLLDEHFNFKYYFDNEINHRINSTIKNTKYSNGDVISESINYIYDNYNFNNKIVKNINNDIFETEFLRSYNFNNPSSNLMKSLKIYNPLISIVNKKNNNILSKEEFNYTTINHRLFLPIKYNFSKGNNNLDPLQLYGYDILGNLDFKQKLIDPNPHNNNSIPKTKLIYGYNNKLLIAKIENYYDNIILPTSLINSIKSETNKDISEYNENNILILLSNLRNNSLLSNAMITTYTHKPLIGVSSVTDPKGDTQTYHYDSFNRLKEVRDKNGNILSENQYHYRP